MVKLQKKIDRLVSG